MAETLPVVEALRGEESSSSVHRDATTTTLPTESVSAKSSHDPSELDTGYYSRSSSTGSTKSVDTRVIVAMPTASRTAVASSSSNSTAQSTELAATTSTCVVANGRITPVAATDDRLNASVGPDQVVATESLSTYERDHPVHLRLGTETDDAAADAPVSVVTTFRRTVKQSGDHNALATKVNGAWKFWTFQQYYDDVWMAAKAFIKLGLEPYHGVGIIGFNSPEWFISDLGAIFAGGLATGLYTTNTAEACQYVAANARCDVIVVENEHQLRKIRQVWDRLPDLKAVVQYSGQPTVDPTSTRPVYSWAEFMKLSESVEDAELEERISQQSVNKCCTLIYTSGTTGNPKGVMLSHDNMIWTARTGSRTMGLTYADEVLVSYLPLSHVAAQILDLYIPIILSVTVYFAQPDALKGSLSETLREVRPTAFLGVPRVWEKMQEKMVSVDASQGYIKRSIISWARSIGLRGNTSLMNGGSVPFGWSIASSLVFRKVRLSMGLDRCRLCLTAAAPIMRDTMDFFSSLDMPILEIFGMSESSGPHTISMPSRYRIGSTGQTMLGTTLEIVNPDKDDCGEICMDGRNVFMGYLSEQIKTAETIDERGLLHSGDIGRVDSDGFLFITGRIKELLITAGGENVAPVPIEDAVKEALPCVSNCMLVGDRKKFLSILLTLKTEVDKQTSEPLDKLSSATIDWMKAKGCPACFVTVTDVLDACSSAHGGGTLAAAIQAGIDRANRAAPSRAQNINKWTILPRDFSVAGGELGPTLKLKRPFVAKIYENTINSIYDEQ